MTIKKMLTPGNSVVTLESLEAQRGGPLTFGDVLRGIRTCDHEVTQAEFARFLRMTRQQVCDIEQGRRILSVQAVSALAKVHEAARLCAEERTANDRTIVRRSVSAELTKIYQSPEHLGGQSRKNFAALVSDVRREIPESVLELVSLRKLKKVIIEILKENANDSDK
jgi:DNA-binding transcriptional regulator YiaG